jgi:hypothetical protein
MNKTSSMNWALILIAVALAGAGVSYHFTLESRFATLEQKLEQNSVTFQQYQIAQETLVSSKMDTINALNKQVEELQASLTPLGRATHEQTDAMADLHKQIAALEQSQKDAQKKLADSAAQTDKIKLAQADIPVSMPIPASTTVVASGPVPAQVSTPAPAPAAAPVVTPIVAPQTPVTSTPSPQLPIIAPRASLTPFLPLPLPPRAESAVDLRPDQATAIADDATVRALPVALPVADVR